MGISQGYAGYMYKTPLNPCPDGRKDCRKNREIKISIT